MSTPQALYESRESQGNHFAFGKEIASNLRDTASVGEPGVSSGSEPNRTIADPDSMTEPEAGREASKRTPSTQNRGSSMKTVSHSDRIGTPPRDCWPIELSGASGGLRVQGRLQWVTNETAYVLVPFGTAKETSERWEATVPASETDATLPTFARRRMTVQLIGADHPLGRETEMEGLLLRIRDAEAAR